MQKKITVYVVKSGEGEAEKSVPFGTKSAAAAAVTLLAQFGIEAKVEAEKRVVTL